MTDKTYNSQAKPLTPASRTGLLADARVHVFQARAARQSGDFSRATGHLARAAVNRDKLVAGSDRGYFPYESSHTFGDTKPNRKLP